MHTRFIREWAVGVGRVVAVCCVKALPEYAVTIDIADGTLDTDSPVAKWKDPGLCAGSGSRVVSELWSSSVCGVARVCHIT
jgi:hypothetical protein